MPHAAEAGVRLAGAVLALLLLVHFQQRALLESLLPLLRWVIGLLDDHYRVLFIGLASQGADLVIRLDVTLVRPLLAGSHLVMPDPRGHASVTTLAGSVLQPPLIVAALLCAWPAAAWREVLVRVAGGGVAVMALLMADLPFVLTGELWALFVDGYRLGGISPILAWKDFLQGGGRLALACAAGVAVIALGRLGTVAPPKELRRKA